MSVCYVKEKKRSLLVGFSLYLFIYLLMIVTRLTWKLDPRRCVPVIFWCKNFCFIYGVISSLSMYYLKLIVLLIVFNNASSAINSSKLFRQPSGKKKSLRTIFFIIFELIFFLYNDIQFNGVDNSVCSKNFYFNFKLYKFQSKVIKNPKFWSKIFLEL